MPRGKIAEDEIYFIKAVGRNIQLAREGQGFTLEDMVARGFPSARVFRQIEIDGPVSMASLFGAARALKVSVDSLFIRPHTRATLRKKLPTAA